MKINIMGLGWLGQPLATRFSEHKAHIYGTSTDAIKIARLNQLGILAHHYNLYTSAPDTLAPHSFDDAALVLNIPPGRKQFNQQAYQDNMLTLIDHAFAQGLSHLVFISTTAVFGEATGRVCNDTPKSPVTLSALAHDLIEKHLMHNYQDRACILRPSGLVGDQRHPALSLSKKSGLTLGKNPVNLIHRDDLINVIEQVIMQKVTGRMFNVSSAQNPTRQDYYSWCAAQLGIKAPGFELDDRKGKAVDGKWIDAAETFEALGIVLKYPSPQSMLSPLIR